MRSYTRELASHMARQRFSCGLAGEAGCCNAVVYSASHCDSRRRIARIGDVCVWAVGKGGFDVGEERGRCRYERIGDRCWRRNKRRAGRRVVMLGVVRCVVRDGKAGKGEVR